MCEKGPHLFPGGIDPVQCDPPRSQDPIWEVEKNNASSEKRRETLTSHLKATSVFKTFAVWTLGLKATSQVKAAIKTEHFSSPLITLMANTGSWPVELYFVLLIKLIIKIVLDLTVLPHN